jgi:hypothetical protein
MSKTAIAVRERPILFSGAMVCAILEGRKTQTRRVLKPEAFSPDPRPVRRDYEAGMRLWIRETWCIEGGICCPGDCNQVDDIDISYAADGKKKQFQVDRPREWGVWIHQRGLKLGTKPSIFMPRWASRITLQITKVRIERVQDITADDAWAEGIQYPVDKPDAKGHVRPYVNISERQCVLDYLPKTGWTHEILMVANYARLWDSLNAERGFSWKKNPWVSVVEFKRLEVEN